MLNDQRPLIRDVFDLSKTDNLRLLRQSLTDLCRFFDRLPEAYRNQTKVLPGLMGDFLALSIAWHAGDRLEEMDFALTDFANYTFPNEDEGAPPHKKNQA